MKSKWTLSIALSLLMSASLMAQSWDRLPGGNIINGTEYLGAATGSTVPLLLKTVPPLLSIDLATTDILRARLKPTGTATINGYGGVVQDGFFLLSGQPDAFTNVNSKAPFTRMHLVDPTGSVNPINYAQQFGFRPWQKNGITFTGNSDQGYIGQKYNYNDATDMVIQWSDNPSTDPWASDKLRFIFSSEPNGSTTGMRSLEGLEAMRLWPKSPTEVNVGIGDFYAAGGGIEPSERLDVLTGKVRIRTLPTDPVNTETNPMAVVVNMTPGTTYGVLEHRPLDNCEWNQYNAPVSTNHVYTAVGGVSSTCPDDDDRVGVGLFVPTSKFHVRAITQNNLKAGIMECDVNNFDNSGLSVYAGQTTIGPNRVGLEATSRGGTTSNLAGSFQAQAVSASSATTINKSVYAVSSIASGTAALNIGGDFNVTGSSATTYGLKAVSAGVAGVTTQNYAGHFQANASATTTYGVAAYSGGNSTTSFGVQAIANGWAVTNYGIDAISSNGTSFNHGVRATSSGTTSTNYGVRASATGGPTNYGIRAGASGGTNNWAGWFDGHVQITGDLWNNATLIFSDAQLKTNVEPFQDASSLLSQFQPKSYNYDVVNYGYMGLPATPQIGLMAQEVETFLPALVRSTVLPTEYDTLGNVTHAEMAVKGIDYVRIVPILIAGYQEQQATITDLQQQMQQMQQQLAQCCNDGTMDGHSMQQGAGSGSTGTLDTDLRIVPNPVAANTQLRYTVGTPGRVRLEVTDNTGRVIEVLEEATRSTGSFTYEWNTQQLAAGTYFCTLYVNDEPLVKKAVKLNER